MDGGRSWRERRIVSSQDYQDANIGRTNEPVTSIEQIHFTDPANGLILQSAGSVDIFPGSATPNGPFFTSDSGANWQCRLTGKCEIMDHDGRFFFVTPKKVIKLGHRGEFMVSGDGGRSCTFANAVCRGFDGMRFGEIEDPGPPAGSQETRWS